MLLRKPVSPMILRNLPARLVLAVPRLHRLDLSQRRSSLRGVAGAVARYQFANQVRPLQHDAALRSPRRSLSKILQELGLFHDLENALLVVNGLPSELNDGARLDIAVRTDVMADAGGHWAERFALVVPIGVDN